MTVLRPSIRRTIFSAIVALIATTAAACVRFVGEAVVATDRDFAGSVESVADCIRDMPMRIYVRGEEPWWFFVRDQFRRDARPEHAPRDLTMSDLPFAWEVHQSCTGCVALVYDEVTTAPTTPVYQRRGHDVRYVAVYGISVVPGRDDATSHVSVIPIHYAVNNGEGHSPHGFDPEPNFEREEAGTHDQAAILDAVGDALRTCAAAEGDTLRGSE